jgi:hypothetical protein
VLAMQFCRTFDGACHDVFATATFALESRQELLYDIMHLNGNHGKIPNEFVQELV